MGLVVVGELGPKTSSPFQTVQISNPQTEMGGSYPHSTSPSLVDPPADRPRPAVLMADVERMSRKRNSLCLSSSEDSDGIYPSQRSVRR